MSKKASLLLGITLIALAVLVLAGNLLIKAGTFHVGGFRLWPLIVIGIGLLFCIPPYLYAGQRGLGGLFIPGLPVLTTGILLFVASVTNHWGLWAKWWPMEVIGVALGFVMAAIFLRVVWLMIPASIIGLTGLVLQFCALTGLWASWAALWTEISLKSWLSGGRQICNRNTWYYHMFRTQRGLSWPYKITDAEVERARCYSREFWLNNTRGNLHAWPHAVHNFEWLLERFRPVPEWHEEVEIPPPPPSPPVRSTTKRRRRRTCSKKIAPVEPPREKKDIEFLVMALTPKSSRYWKKFVRELAKQGDEDAS